MESGATTPTRRDQVFSPKERYATGNRNAEGFDFDADGRLYVTQHGRDQLHEDWPELYTAKQGWELPCRGGDDPEAGRQLRLAVLLLRRRSRRSSCWRRNMAATAARRSAGCDTLDGPVAAFPAHWAPNDLKIYKGTQFPKAYQGGAFIAFHGSWNRAPGPQGGYNVVFQPLADGKASGDYVVFADGFAGPKKEPARRRASSLGSRRRTRRCALHHRRQGRPHLARDL